MDNTTRKLGAVQQSNLYTDELSPAMLALRDAPDIAPLQITTVAFAELVAGLPFADWIQAEATFLESSPSYMDRIAAVGLAVRLWTPTGSNAHVAAQRLLTGTPSPTDRAAAWARTLPQETLEEIERAALCEANGLVEDANTLVRTLLRHPLMFRDAVRQLVRRRDDLESILTVLELGGGGGVLRAALFDTDEEVTEHALVFAATEAFDDDLRLCAVAWNEPSAWWGLLAVEY